VNIPGRSINAVYLAFANGFNFETEFLVLTISVVQHLRYKEISGAQCLFKPRHRKSGAGIVYRFHEKPDLPLLQKGRGSPDLPLVQLVEIEG
jgi:hypothetical protein